MRIAELAARRHIAGGVVVLILSFCLLAAPATAGSAVIPSGFQAFCAANPSECKGGGAASVTYDDALAAQLRSVNAKVNAAIKPVKSEAVDVWSLNVKKGDCEDYVLAKRHALIASEDRQNFAEAKQVLKNAVNRDNDNPFAWYQLGIVYDREGDEPRAALATAERNNLEGHNKLALTSARMAMAGLPAGSPDYLRAQDIAMVSEEAVKKDKKNGERER